MQGGRLDGRGPIYDRLAPGIADGLGIAGALWFQWLGIDDPKGSTC